MAIRHTTLANFQVRSIWPPLVTAITLNTTAACTGANQIQKERGCGLVCICTTLLMR